MGIPGVLIGNSNWRPECNTNASYYYVNWYMQPFLQGISTFWWKTMRSNCKTKGTYIFRIIESICERPHSRGFYYVNYGLSIITSYSSNFFWFLVRCFFSKIKNKCFKAKRELKCQNKLFLKCHFSGNTSVYVFIPEIIWQTFEGIIDNP